MRGVAYFAVEYTKPVVAAVLFIETTEAVKVYCANIYNNNMLLLIIKCCY